MVVPVAGCCVQFPQNHDFDEVTRTYTRKTNEKTNQ